MTVRRRRTADESRSLILDVASKRLREQGLEGLNIKGVAEEAGISHATLIHHFGSSLGMRDALAERMTVDLVNDLIEALDAREPPEALIRNVFAALNDGGHAKLIAWRAVEGGNLGENEEVAERLKALLDRGQAVFDMPAKAEMQNIVMLVAMAAIGFGLAGSVLGRALDMSAEDLDAFPDWMKAHLMQG